MTIHKMLIECKDVYNQNSSDAEKNLLLMNNDTKNILSEYDKNITVLDLSNKNIICPLCLYEFVNLKILDCSNNSITELLGLYDGLESLKCQKIISLNYIIQ